MPQAPDNVVVVVGPVVLVVVGPTVVVGPVVLVVVGPAVVVVALPGHPISGSYTSGPQKAVVLPCEITRPGPGKPAVLFTPKLDVDGMQKIATPTGYVGSGSPCAVIVGRKHSRRFESIQLPALTPMFDSLQSALPVH